jgi:hypothetical protein
MSAAITYAPKQVLAMVQVMDDMDAIYAPVMKPGRSESVWANDVAPRDATLIVWSPILRGSI